MQKLRAVHRLVTLLVAIFTLYLGITGTLIQSIDLKSIFSHAPATDLNMQSIREGINGGGGFQVISIPDYTAAPLNSSDHFVQLFATVLNAARREAPESKLRFIELRVVSGREVGQVDTGNNLMRFDAHSGDYLGAFPIIHESESPDSQRNFFKHLHRMTTFGDYILFINVAVAIGLAILIVTGVWMYFKLFLPRSRTGRSNPFWKGGGWWRSLHRSLSILAALYLSVVVFSGFWLAYESLYFGLYNRLHQPVPGQHRADPITPINDASIPGMLQTTLASYQHAMPGVPMRVIRLRSYGGMQQGIVITGENEPRQLVYNATTGARASETEPGYPVTGFPFGWQAHQYAKMLHRGDMFGMTGRMMDLFSGLSMIYLSISGIVMYYQHWKVRRHRKRDALVSA